MFDAISVLLGILKITLQLIAISKKQLEILFLHENEKLIFLMIYT